MCLKRKSVKQKPPNLFSHLLLEVNTVAWKFDEMKANKSTDFRKSDVESETLSSKTLLLLAKGALEQGI